MTVMPNTRTDPSPAFVNMVGGGFDPVLCGGDLSQRLAHLHTEMKADPDLAGINRIAAALHDPATDLLKTFVHSSDGPNPVEGAAVRLSELPTLSRLARSGRALVVDDLLNDEAPAKEIGSDLVRHGYRSRCVMPVMHQDTLFGFIFYNSFVPRRFGPATLTALRPHHRLIVLMIVNELVSVRTMLASVRTARAVSHHRDEETSGHLDRMAHYARLIARRVAPTLGLSDAWVEYLFHYAPLHDLGKVAVPDNILLKPGRLTAEEFAVMKTHVVKGVEIVDGMRQAFGLSALPYGEMLRNVVACHHEALDGSGYPFGLKGDAVPMEGRIVSVADVFDALTSVRPYKSAWTNEDALAFLHENTGTRFDKACVAALTAEMEKVEEIQRVFGDEAAG